MIEYLTISSGLKTKLKIKEQTTTNKALFKRMNLAKTTIDYFFKISNLFRSKKWAYTHLSYEIPVFSW